MIRSWAVRPDARGVVTREMLIEAFVDAATMLDLAGGTLEVVVGRAATGVPNEMYMTGAVLMWKDRTDAKAQAEVAVQVTPEPEPLVELQSEANEVAEERIDLGKDKRDREANLKSQILAGEPVKDPADGFDFSKLEEEDVEGEPVGR